jgi:hypothetical protein
MQGPGPPPGPTDTFDSRTACRRLGAYRVEARRGMSGQQDEAGGALVRAAGSVIGPVRLRGRDGPPREDASSQCGRRPRVRGGPPARRRPRPVSSSVAAPGRASYCSATGANVSASVRLPSPLAGAHRGSRSVRTRPACAGSLPPQLHCTPAPEAVNAGSMAVRSQQYAVTSKRRRVVFVAGRDDAILSAALPCAQPCRGRPCGGV